MNLKTLAVIAALLSSATAFAATVDKTIPQGVTESTDPAKAAEVERHAQEIQSHSKGAMSTSGTGSKKPVKHHRAHKKAKSSTAKTPPAQ